MLSKSPEITAITRDGTSITLRPPTSRRRASATGIFAHLSQEDVRLRFFGPMRELSRTLTDRLSHLDYRREMAIIAQHNGATLGAASYFLEPDARSAEFAITVRSDWHGRGIGYLLLSRVMEVVREVGVDELCGVVLRENKPMLDMCRALGFRIAREPTDATVLRVRKVLAAGG